MSRPRAWTIGIGIGALLGGSMLVYTISRIASNNLASIRQAAQAAGVTPSATSTGGIQFCDVLKEGKTRIVFMRCPREATGATVTFE